MDNPNPRRRWVAEEKLTILQKDRQAGHTESDVCWRHQIQATQFYLSESHANAGALAALPGHPDHPR